MSWWDRLFGRKASVLDQLPAFMTYPETKSGQSVTYATALQVSTVLACCRVLAEGISQVPLKLLRPRAEGGADAAVDHPLYRLLYRRPNSWQTSFEFRETMMLHLVLCGNAYVWANRDRKGTPIELLPTFIIGKDLQNGNLQAVLSEYIPVERHVYAMYLPTRHLPSKVRLFIDFMISHIGEEPYWDR